MPDFDFDAYNHDEVEGEEGLDDLRSEVPSEIASAPVTSASASEEVDKW